MTGTTVPDDVERNIVDLLRAKGPCTGGEIQDAFAGVDSLQIWKACRSSRELAVRTVGRRYMRLERNVEGYARLSPSILREFLTYSVVGVASDPEALERRCLEIGGRILEISQYKLGLAREMVFEIMEEFRGEVQGDHRVCFILAGDIVYHMAHNVPRPEHSTGKLVKGSDIDLIVVVGDAFPEPSFRKLDRIIYAKKYRMLIDPSVNEEVDYIIKRLATIETQAGFEDFRHKVAMKILKEGVMLHGSEELFDTIKTLLKDRGLVEKLDELERQAKKHREDVEASLLGGLLDRETIRKTHLFFSADEFEEFE